MVGVNSALNELSNTDTLFEYRYTFTDTLVEYRYTCRIQIHLSNSDTLVE